MKQLLYIKTDNEINDICCVGGMCKILKDNFIQYTLITQHNCYIIDYDELDIDVDGLIFIPIDEDTSDTIKLNINSNCNRSEAKQRIQAINSYFAKHIDTILEDFNNIDDLTDKENIISVGNHFCSASNGRANTNVKITTLRKNLSFFGFMQYATLLRIQDAYDINCLMIPRNGTNITNLIHPSVLEYKIKDTDEIKQQQFFGKNNKYSITEIEALVLLNTYIMSYLEKNDYSKIIIMQYKAGGQKPLIDKTLNISISNKSKEFYEVLKNKIYTNTINKKTGMYEMRNADVRFTTANFALNHSYKNFIKMMMAYNKNNEKINKEIGDEIMNSYSNEISSIFNNEIVNKLGYGLNRLVSQDKGFMILTKLHNVKNEKDMINTTMLLLTTYTKNKKTANKSNAILLNNDEIKEIANLLTNKEIAKIMASCVIMLGTCFYVYKKDNK